MYIYIYLISPCKCMVIPQISASTIGTNWGELYAHAVSPGKVDTRHFGQLACDHFFAVHIIWTSSFRGSASTLQHLAAESGRPVALRVAGLVAMRCQTCLLASQLGISMRRKQFTNPGFLVPLRLWFLSKPVRMCLFRTTAEAKGTLVRCMPKSWAKPHTTAYYSHNS